jgi:hypothetical protein
VGASHVHRRVLVRRRPELGEKEEWPQAVDLMMGGQD